MTKQKVLIVEDNELNMRLFNDLLEANGYYTIKSDNGLDAIDLTKEHMPELIIMDIQLPTISGMDLIVEIKEDKQIKNIPILAVTAFAMKGDEEKIRRSGCDDYMPKPISIQPFLDKVEKLINEG